VSKVAIICAHCGSVAYKEAGGVNRSRGRGAPVFCSRECSGARRRIERSTEEKRALKAEYDRKRRAELGEALLAEKREARRRLLAENPQLVRAREKANRDANKERHLEYCRRPEYKKWKSQYDQKHRARKWFGDFGEAAIILNQLIAEISTRATRTEIYRANGTLNKHQERRRDYERQTQRR